MKLYVIGDVHASFGYLNTFLNKKRPNYVIACGDFGYWPNFKDCDPKVLKTHGGKVYFCDGNHEDHLALRNLSDTEVGKNVFYMPRGTVKEFPFLGNTLFMGGADSIDKDMRTEGLDWFREELITEADLINLPDEKIDTVISHTCPEEFHPWQRSGPIPWDRDKTGDPSQKALSYILERYEPSQWFFGHWHCWNKGKYKNTHWTALDMVYGISHWAEKFEK